jgi:hypothetical protein
MKRVTIALLKSMLVEKIGVVSYFADFVADLGVLGIFVPLGKGLVLVALIKQWVLALLVATPERLIN